MRIIIHGLGKYVVRCYSKWDIYTFPDGRTEYINCGWPPDNIDEGEKSNLRDHAKAFVCRVFDSLVQIGKRGDSFFRYEDDVIYSSFSEEALNRRWAEDNAKRQAQGLPSLDYAAFMESRVGASMPFANKGFMVRFPYDNGMHGLITYGNAGMNILFYGNPSDETLARCDSLLASLGLVDTVKECEMKHHLNSNRDSAGKVWLSEGRSGAERPNGEHAKPKRNQVIRYSVILACICVVLITLCLFLWTVIT